MKVWKSLVGSLVCALGSHDYQKTQSTIQLLDRRFCADPKNHVHELWECTRCPAKAVRIGRFIKLGREYHYGM